MSSFDHCRSLRAYKHFFVFASDLHIGSIQRWNYHLVTYGLRPLRYQNGDQETVRVVVRLQYLGEERLSMT